MLYCNTCETAGHEEAHVACSNCVPTTQPVSLVPRYAQRPFPMKQSHKNPQVSKRRQGKHRDLESARRIGGRPQRRLRVVHGVIGLVIITASALGFLLVADNSTKRFHVVVPDDLAELDPQLRDYLNEKISWGQQDPNDAERHATLGLVYSANARWQEARDSFQNAVDLDPGAKLSVYYLATATQRLGDSEVAIAILQGLIKQHPDFAPAHHRLGVLLLERGSETEAEESFRRSVELAPEAAEGYIGLAEVLLRRGEHERSTEHLRTALRAKPNNLKAHYLLGMAYRGLGMRAEAEQELKLGAKAQQGYMADPWSRSVIQHAKGVAFQNRQGQRLLQRGRAQDAALVLETLLKWHPESVEGLNNLAIAYMALKRYSKAHELLARAAELDADNMATYINLTVYSTDVGDLDAALGHADRAVELSPVTPEAHAARGRVLLRLNRANDAGLAFEEAARLDPLDPALQMWRAHAHMVQGHLEAARDGYLAAAELSPKSVEAQLRLGDACIRLEDLDCAARAVAAARNLAPNHRQVSEMERRLQSLQSE